MSNLQPLITRERGEPCKYNFLESIMCLNNDRDHILYPTLAAAATRCFIYFMVIKNTGRLELRVSRMQIKNTPPAPSECCCFIIAYKDDYVIICSPRHSPMIFFSPAGMCVYVSGSFPAAHNTYAHVFNEFSNSLRLYTKCSTLLFFISDGFVNPLAG